ncbi:hypothetical protein V1477_017602 [Vespula maculifrons]|uniref:Uncharacterized protein n=1 Tax=Vespula maculifrons TaxID=7453 RepID=A0ABD2B6I1_VESMC
MELKRREEKRKEKKRKEMMDLIKTGKRSWKNLEICSHSLGNTSIPLNSVTTKVLPTQVPPRGGCCILYRRTFNRAREHHAYARRHTRDCSSYPTRIPRGYIEIREEEEKMKRKKNRRREREEEKKQMRGEENKSVRTPEKDEAEKKRKKRISERWNGT